MNKRFNVGLRIRCSLIVVLALTFAMVEMTFAQAPGAQIVEDELIIQLKAGASGRMTDALTRLNAVTHEEIPQIQIKRLKVPAHKRENIKSALSRNPNVSFVEDNYIAEAVLIPNDSKYNSQWHFPVISAPQGWDLNTGSQNVTIAVIDSGAASNHADLGSKLLQGYNFLDENAVTNDTHGHGTWVTGAAASISNNFTGVAGVAWDNPVMPLLVVNDSGRASYYDIARALAYSANNNAKIVNISVAGSSRSSILQMSVNYAWNRGVVIFAAAGNNSTNTPYYPAACDNVIAVAATTARDSRASFSNYGDWIDIAAPGVSILTTNKNGGYSSVSGTSLASPVAAGLGALIVSANPFLSGNEVVNIIRENTDDLGAPGFDIYFGYGRINVYKSLLAASGSIPEPDTTEPSVLILSPSDGETVSGNITVSISATDNVGVTEVELYINDNLYGTDMTEPYEFNWVTGNYPDGYHDLKAVAYDNAGNAGQSSPAVVNVQNNVPGDTTAPDVLILSPPEGSTLGRRETVEVSASDDSGIISKIEFYVDDVLVSVKTDSKKGVYSWRWNTRKLSSGEHLVTAKAYDGAGNVNTDSIVVNK